jgi:hypothetical protein
VDRNPAVMMCFVRRLTWLTFPFLLAAGPTGLVACGDATGTGTCCKVCSKGKACGDTCIEATKTCHVGAGCACNA